MLRDHRATQFGKRVIGKLRAQVVGERAQDRPILARLAGRKRRTFRELRTTLGIDVNRGLFRVGRTRQDDVGAVGATVAVASDINDERAILDFKLKEHHNRFFNSQKRQLDRERSLDHGPLRDELPGDASTPSAQAARNEDLAALTAAMERLPEKYRRVIVWHHWEKLTFIEIGRRLNRSEDAARMLFGRAIDRLAREME